MMLGLVAFSPCDFVVSLCVCVCVCGCFFFFFFAFFGVCGLWQSCCMLVILVCVLRLELSVSLSLFGKLF